MVSRVETSKNLATPMRVLNFSLQDALLSNVFSRSYYVVVQTNFFYLVELRLIFADFWGVSLARVACLPGFTTSRTETG